MAWYWHAAALGAAPGRIALDQVEFALVDLAAGAIAEFAGQPAAAHGALPLADQGLGLSGRLAGLGRLNGLATIALAVFGCSSR